jgi:hypothetical protein
MGKIKIYIDRKEYFTDNSVISGREIKKLVGLSDKTLKEDGLLNQ